MSIWDTELDSETVAQEKEQFQNTGHLQYKSKADPGFFTGSATAPLRGIAAGMVKTYETAAQPFRQIGDYLEYTIDDYNAGGLEGGLDFSGKSFQDVKGRKDKARNERFVTEIEQLEDHENTGTLGNIGFGIGDVATRAVFGSVAGGMPGAIAMTGASEAKYSYEYLINKGVDPETALKVAGTDGAIAAAATALPMSYGFKGTGGVFKDGVLSIGGATALSTGGRYASNQILESNDYKKQAKKYELTSESFTTDLFLNTLFFGAARGSRAYLDRGIDRELNDVRGRNDQAETNLTLEQIEARENLIDATLEVNRMQFEDSSAPVTPHDPIQHNNHLINLNAAEEQLRTGQPVNVPMEVKGTPKPKMVNIAPSEYKNIRYDDPRLDLLLSIKAKQMDMEWAVPLLLSIRRAGEKSNNNQVSPVGARSIMQIMPETQAGLESNYKKKWDVNNPEHATEMALYLVRELSQQYKTKDPLVLAAHYNGGFSNGRAMQKNGKANAKETIDYVNRIDKFISTGEYKKYNGNNVSKAYGMDGSIYDTAYEIKPYDDLITSNDAAFGVNPNYPTELQPRDRTRAASQQQVEEMANSLRPELLGESYKLSDGAPIIGMDNVVESGNGRIMAIGKAFEIGKAEEYRSYIEQYAREKGWDISGINKPVLVRTRLTDTDRIEFSRLANQSDVAQFSSTERAISDADRLPDSTTIKINNDGTINLDGSMDFVRGFVDQLPQSERTAAITSDGRLSQEGKRRIESALVQRAYGDSNLVTRLTENLDDDSKTVLNALLRAAPQLAQLGDLVAQGGRHSNTLAADIAQAAQKLSDLKASGQTVKDYLNQGQLIDDGLTSGARDFLSVFDSNNRSAKAIGEDIQAKINEIEVQGDPHQGSLFGESADEKLALEIINLNPEQEIAVSRVSPQGELEEITMTVRERLDELDLEATAAKEQGIAAEAAVNCFLMFGE